MNQEILHFRNQPVKEVAREAFSLVYQLLRFEVFGQDNLEFMRRGIPAIVGFFPHTSHADGPAVRKAFPRDLRKRLIYPAAADY